MTIYFDILFINNTIMTLAIIWAVGQILNFKVRWWRLLLAAVLGSIYTIIVFIVDVSDRYFFLQVIWYLGLNLLTAYLLIITAYGKFVTGKLIKAIAYLYLISFITVGAVLSLFNIYGITVFAKSNFLRAVVGLIIIIYLAKFGWHIFHRYRLPDELLLPVTIELGQKKLKLIGLIDTGNQLSDPLTDLPVLVIEIGQFKELLPPELAKSLDNEEVMAIIDEFRDAGWGDRIRVLPFSDLGQEHGLLAGIRPDQIILEDKGREIIREKVLLALTTRKLDDDNAYQMLINPRIFKTGKGSD